MGRTDRISELEIYWPTSRTTQTFRGIFPNQAIEITEGADDLRILDKPRVPLPNP